MTKRMKAKGKRRTKKTTITLESYTDSSREERETSKIVYILDFESFAAYISDFFSPDNDTASLPSTHLPWSCQRKYVVAELL